MQNVDSSLLIHHRNSELIVVPARHYSHIFAEAVNRICRDPAQIPDAIAVELSPCKVEAALSWFRELGVGRTSYTSLPAMLALLWQTNESPAPLNYSALFLSPSDSIIEALRCSIELGIPAYGVDIDGPAGRSTPQVILEDIRDSGCELGSWVDRNLIYADFSREPSVDDKRELVMAMRLKNLLDRHRRILFSGGLAHWLRLRSILTDNSVKVADLSGEDCREIEVRRAVVHPKIAAPYMDLFPALTYAYERQRKRADCRGSTGLKAGSLSSKAIFKSCLKRAYRSVFGGRQQHCRDIELIPLFEQYLANRLYLGTIFVPDLSLIIQTAGEMLSTELVQEIYQSFMKFPWASLSEYGGCDVLLPHLSMNQEAGYAISLAARTGVYDSFLALDPILEGGCGTAPMSIPYEWEKSCAVSGYGLYTWRPWEYLISSMSFKVVSNMLGRQRIRKSVAFEGAILEGIDVKSTVREYARGVDNPKVWDSSHTGKAEAPRLANEFPIVLILDSGTQAQSQWMVLYENLDLIRNHIRNSFLLDQVIKKQGNKFIALIGYGESEQVSLSQSLDSYKLQRYRGMAVFEPMCWTHCQYSRWAELTRYAKNPYCRNSQLDSQEHGSLGSWFRKKHGIDIRRCDWTTALILMALPFARSTLRIVIPAGFQLSDLVFENARTHRVKIHPIPLSIFTEDEIRRMQVCPLVPVTQLEPEPKYPELIEKALGESQERNRELAPAAWLNFGL